MRTRLAAAACLVALLAADAGAALVDAEYAEIRDTAVGGLFISYLRTTPDGAAQPASAQPAAGSQAGTQPDAAPAPVAGAQPAASPLPIVTVVDPLVEAPRAADPPAAPVDPTKDLKRVLVSWEGVKSPPVIRFVGIPAEAYIASIAGGKPGTPTALGASWPMPNMPGFFVVAVKADELVISVPATLEKLALTPCPEPSGHALRFTGPGSDLKLGEVQDKVKDFELTYDHGGLSKAMVNTPSDKDAKSLDRWIWWRKPVVFAGADVGIRKLKFPSRLLDQTDLDRKKSTLIASTTLKDDMRTQAFEYLADAIRREVRRFQK